MKRPVVAVFGSGERSSHLAEEAGRAIAHRGWHLLTGGGSGTMEAATRGFTSVTPRQGLALGIIPGPEVPNGYPNLHVELAIFTPLTSDPSRPRNRNWVNVATAWGALVLPGGAGTRQELLLCRELQTPALEVQDLAEALRWLEGNLSDPATRSFRTDAPREA